MNKKYSQITLSSTLSVFVTIMISALMGESYWFDNYAILSFTSFILHFLIFSLYTRKAQLHFSIKDIITLVAISSVIVLIISPLISYSDVFFWVISGTLWIMLGVKTALKWKKTDIEILLIFSNIVGLTAIIYWMFYRIDTWFCMHPICGLIQISGFLIPILPTFLSFLAWGYYDKKNNSISNLGVIYALLPFILLIISLPFLLN